jgi:hypothetical protein
MSANAQLFTRSTRLEERQVVDPEVRGELGAGRVVDEELDRHGVLRVERDGAVQELAERDLIEGPRTASRRR